jgi:hypothetical protein
VNRASTSDRERHSAPEVGGDESRELAQAQREALRARVQQLEESVEALRRDRAYLVSRLQESDWRAYEERCALEEDLRQVTESASWRMTRLLRALKRLVGR